MTIPSLGRHLPVLAITVASVVIAGCGGDSAQAPGIAAPAGLAYSVNPAVYTVGTAIAANAPSSSGGAVESYSVSPALPAGLSLGTATGIVTGNPTIAAPLSSYTVTARNPGGQATTILGITVDPANARPVANAGPSQRVPVGSPVTLDGGASSDADGNPLTYAWSLTTRPAGSTAVIRNASDRRPTMTPDRAGRYVATLTVNDGRKDGIPSEVGISSEADLRLLIDRSASQSSVWIDGVAQAGSRFPASSSRTAGSCP